MTAGSERSAPIILDRTRRSSIQAGHSSSVCCAVSSSEAQCQHCTVRSRPMRHRYLPKQPWPVIICVTWNDNPLPDPAIRPDGEEMFASFSLFKVLLIFSSFNNFYPCHNVNHEDFCRNNLKMTLSSFFDILRVLLLLKKSTFFCSLYQITSVQSFLIYAYI